MQKSVAYLAASVVFLGIGALVAGLSIWYYHPDIVKKNVILENRYAQCDLQSPDNSVNGTLFFEQFQSSSPVLISGNITGLTEGLHGFHVHQFGGLQNGCKDAGGHYNPFSYNHSAPNATKRHVGDLGNVEATLISTETITRVAITDTIVTLFDDYSIAGRAIVVHAGEDDLGLVNNEDSIKTGNAGGRVACCIVYFTKPRTK